MKTVRNASIVGLPRSGTSLTAAIFVKKNYRTPSDLLPSNDANPFGYWEAESLNDHNAAVWIGADHSPRVKTTSMRASTITSGPRWMQYELLIFPTWR
jgi:hypothetical protein